MNNLCPICEEPFNITKFTTLYSETYQCFRDNLYMCPDASMPDVYKNNYELHYKLYAREQLSKELNKARWNFVEKSININIPIILDFGCGIASFEKYAPKNFKVYSYDPYFRPAMEFLKEDKIHAMTFWDSFEHMRRIDLVPLLKADYLILSLPLFNGSNLFKWRHYRPDEHVWCFTLEALNKLMTKWEYRLIAEDDFEIRLGRHDIYSFVFYKGYV